MVFKPTFTKSKKKKMWSFTIRKREHTVNHTNVDTILKTKIPDLKIEIIKEKLLRPVK